MATNEVFEPANILSLAASAPASPESGDICRYGVRLIGVALTDERDDGTTTIQFDGVHTLLVKGEDKDGNAAINAGDLLYYDDAKPTLLNADNTGTVLAGVALAGVSSGASTATRVRLLG